MKRKIITGAIAAGIVVAVYVLVAGFPGQLMAPAHETGIASSPANIEYTIDGKQYVFLNGVSEERVPESVAIIRTVVFDVPAYGDLNRDGKPDAGVLLQQESGGSGVFYYMAAALNMNGQYLGTNALLLGDRIAPQGVEIRNGVLIANYADRKPREPMTAQPSVGVSKYAVIRGAQLREISPAEANILLH